VFKKMNKLFAALLISLILPVWASAQQPLSPPERSPVPLSDTDQHQADIRAKSNPQIDTSIVQTLFREPGGALAGGLSSGDPAIDALVRDAAARYGVDPRLILLVMQAESGFRFRAVSPRGATGLMQLMPSTAVRLGVNNILDPRENIFGGVKYLRWLLDRFEGDLKLALAGYNAGEHAVESYGNQVPPYFETQSYVRSIILRYIRSRRSGGFPLFQDTGIEKSREKIPNYNQIIQFTSTLDVGQGGPDRRPQQ
jgi:soluble lytic murein transglycosylase-like protein